MSLGEFRSIKIRSKKKLQVDFSGTSTVQFEGRRYALVQFHFHRGSETQLDDKQFALEVHFVHRSSDCVLGKQF